MWPSIDRPTLGYTLPFFAFVGVMALEKVLGIPLVWSYALRLALAIVVLAWFSRPYLTFRPTAPLLSAAIGVAVFAVWVGPDLFFSYRHSWLFENPLFGSPATSIAPDLKSNVPFLAMRILGSSILVPIVEELFWRGWLMRWLVEKDFEKVPLGKYVPSAFWIVAILFASEHGSYWEVGLAAGVIYNWLIIRTRNLGDCILAHGITNAILAGYIIAGGRWQYWL